MDQIKDMMDQLADLDSDQVTDLQNSIIKEFESVEKEDPTPQTVDAMSSLADMLDTVRGEFKRREAAAQELAQRAAEAASRVYGEDGEKDKEADSEDMKEEMPAESEAAMHEDKKDEMPAEAPSEEVPAAEAPVAEEMPAEEEAPSEAMDEEKKKEEEKMSEASTEADKTAEFSAESNLTEAAAVAEEAVVADGSEPEAAVAAEVVADATAEAEAPVSEEAPAEAVVADEAVASDVADAAADVADGAEASVVTTTENPTESMTQEIMEAPVTAAAENADHLNIEVPADRRPITETSAAAVAITAGADIPGYTAGSSMDSMSDVSVAMEKRLHALRRVNGGDGEQHIVASITTKYPEARVLTQDAESNWAKVQAVAGPEALVASGGHSAPFEVKYDIFGLGTTDRPLRDALPKFQADRGGIRFVTPPVLSTYASAVGVWTAANDSAETPSPASKLSLTVTAASENTVATDAVTLQLQFGNLMSRAYPELIARHNELGLIQHAREAEEQILTRLTALSTAMTSTSLIGVARDFLVQLGRAASNYRGRHRLGADAPLRVIAPYWIKDAMVADLAIAMPGDSTLNAASEIDGYLAARNINITYHLEDFVTAASAGALNEFPDTFVWYIFAEGTFLFLDGGTLDLGVIRDSTLVGTNDYKMFVETFEGVAKVGVESLKVTSTISVNGVAAALRDTTGGATAAAIEY
jgi:chemotaxis protein histidine kinase CheA